jgi:hypothetical protein
MARALRVVVVKTKAFNTYTAYIYNKFITKENEPETQVNT